MSFYYNYYLCLHFVYLYIFLLTILYTYIYYIHINIFISIEIYFLYFKYCKHKVSKYVKIYVNGFYQNKSWDGYMIINALTNIILLSSIY